MTSFIAYNCFVVLMLWNSTIMCFGQKNWLLFFYVFTTFMLCSIGKSSHFHHSVCLLH